MTNKTYDWLKDIITIVLPGLATFYSVFAGIWGLPFGEPIAATIAALVTFGGVVLKVLSTRYAKQPVETDGTVVVNNTDPNVDTLRLEITKEQFDALQTKGVVMLGVHVEA